MCTKYESQCGQGQVGMAPIQGGIGQMPGLGPQLNQTQRHMSIICQQLKEACAQGGGEGATHTRRAPGAPGMNGTMPEGGMPAMNGTMPEGGGGEEEEGGNFRLEWSYAWSRDSRSWRNEQSHWSHDHSWNARTTIRNPPYSPS